MRRVGFELFYRALKRADSVAFVPPFSENQGNRPGFCTLARQAELPAPGVACSCALVSFPPEIQATS